MLTGDTIAAISSAVGVARRMIVRLSGPQTFAIAAHFVAPLARSAGVTRIMIDLDGSPLPAWAYAFIAPHSYTAEDSLELHIPGNPAIAARLLAICIAHGARAAEPGEFTARAYFNGRLDLTQAEGVAAIISAQGDADLAAARRLLGGELSTRLRPLLDRLTETLALIELAIDFSEEDVDFASPAILGKRLSSITADLNTLADESTRLSPQNRQPIVVLFGRPNAGKSTLLNALAGHERAVVSPIAGTTRDVLSATVSLHRGTIELQDAAGLDTGEAADELSEQMRARALGAIAAADIAVRVDDATVASPPIDAGRVADLVVQTKIDLLNAPRDAMAFGISPVSAVTGQGMDEFRRQLDVLAFGSLAPAAKLSLTTRHLDSLAVAREALRRAHPASPLELLAGDLRDAIDALGSIIGVVAPDDVLGKIFGAFCIGK